MGFLPQSSGGGAGALTLISDTTLAAPGSFDITGIAGTYNDLILVADLQSAAAGVGDTPTIRFNNDSAGNYIYCYDRASAATPQSNEGLAQSSIQWGLNACPGSTGLANGFSGLEATVFGYASTTWVKMVRCNNAGVSSGLTGTIFPATVSGIWNSTAAITRVQVAATSNFVIGSRLRIYGRL